MAAHDRWDPGLQDKLQDQRQQHQDLPTERQQEAEHHDHEAQHVTPAPGERAHYPHGGASECVWRCCLFFYPGSSVKKGLHPV
jgi:hypothetical protein